MTPVFIMSSERSGSNLLRKMLGAHSRVAAPPPPQLFKHLGIVLPHYGPLSDDACFRQLVRDAVKLTKIPNSHLRWQVVLDEGRVLSEIPHRSLAHVIGTLYRLYAEEVGCDVWACKENNLFDHAFRIVNAYPKARFVYLCRDGRDVACSIKKVPTHDQHPYFIGQEWANEQMRCLQVYQDLQDSGGCMILRYEDLIENPGERLAEVCRFIGISYEDSMLDYHRDPQTQADAQKTAYWKNLSAPVMKDNKKKYLRELSPREIELFESVAARALKLLGYPLHNASPPEAPSAFAKMMFGLENHIRSGAKRGKLFEEKGRRERDQALRQLHARRSGPVATAFTGS